MQVFNQSLKTPILKKIDTAAFEQIAKFKLSPTYNSLQDFYSGLDEEQQKVFKAFMLLLVFLLPTLLIGIVWFQNNSLKVELETKQALISKGNEYIGQKNQLRIVTPKLISSNPIDGESMMTTRISNIFSTSGIDLSKVQVSNYKGELFGATVFKSEADFKFQNLSTDELVNVFSTMIQKEKFRIENLEITRNPDSNLLQGVFRAVHFGVSQSLEDE